jgi:amino acid transporter
MSVNGIPAQNYETALSVVKDQSIDSVLDKVGAVAAPVVGSAASLGTTILLGELALLAPAAAPAIFTASPVLIAGAGLTAAVATPILVKNGGSFIFNKLGFNTSRSFT